MRVAVVVSDVGRASADRIGIADARFFIHLSPRRRPGPKFVLLRTKKRHGIPAFAGMTKLERVATLQTVVPAHAGTQRRCLAFFVLASMAA
jgi:hypothetical protein